MSGIENENNWYNGIDFESLRKERDEVARNNSGRFQGVLTDEELNKAQETYHKQFGFKNKGEAKISLAAICQQGATNQGGLEQIVFDYKGIKVSAKDAKAVLTKDNPNFTLRKYAKTTGTEIQRVSFALGIEGDLAKKRQLEVGLQTDLEASWCSNFQTGNPECPNEVRQWLVRNFHERFSR